MSRISIPSVEASVESSQALLQAVQKQMGMVPNLMKLVGHSSPALEAYLSLNGALAKGSLNAQLRERIALAVAQYNGCEYCLSAHTYIGKNLAKLSDAEIHQARKAQSDDPDVAAALQFALRVAQSRGRVSDDDLAQLRAHGYNETAVIEIVANVALNILTNYINNVAQTDVDFPLVKADA